MDTFWINVSNFLTVMREVTTAPEVIIAANNFFPGWDASSSGEAFFPGSGGDDQLSDALNAAGWAFRYIEGDYHWYATAPDRTIIEYIEGDIFQRTPEQVTAHLEWLNQ